MTKKELEEKFYATGKFLKSDVERFLDALKQITYKELAEGNEILLPGIGKIQVTYRSARMGINPKTRERIEIPTRAVIKFKVAKPLKDILK